MVSFLVVWCINKYYLRALAKSLVELVLIENRIRQESMLLSLFFARFIKELLRVLVKCVLQ